MNSRPALVVGVLAACGLAVSLMQTLVVPLLPRYPQLLNASTSTVTWLVTATLVAGAVCAPMLGRLGDMYGKRRMLVVALGLVTVGSALGALAPDVTTLIVARALQGASLGVVPLGISIMRDVLPEGRVGGGVALMSSSLGIGGAVGLPLTGVVAEHASWRWLFAGAAVLGVVCWPCCAGSTSRRCARAAASTCRARSASRWRWSACCSRSRRVSSGARSRPSPCSGPRPSYSGSGAASSCARARRSWTCGSARDPPCSGRTWRRC